MNLMSFLSIWTPWDPGWYTGLSVCCADPQFWEDGNHTFPLSLVLSLSDKGFAWLAQVQLLKKRFQ